MELPTHDLAALFKQLGLDAEPADISAFIATHSPLPANLKLADAQFWSAAQADFLREEVREDADWAEIVDQLDMLLHQGSEGARQPLRT